MLHAVQYNIYIVKFQGGGGGGKHPARGGGGGGGEENAHPLPPLNETLIIVQ